jgi:SulP family sulfate permease
MILVNRLDATGLFFSIGLYYILAGVYFGVTVPIQPMKVISAYAIAMGLTAHQVLASGLLMGVFLLVIGATGAMSLIGRYTPRSVVRGVQLSTGVLLMIQGIRFMLGTSTFQSLHQMAEPYLTVQAIAGVPIGIIIGVCGAILTFLFLDNKRLPAGLLVVFYGLLLGLILNTREGWDQLKIGFYLPQFLPAGMPAAVDFSAVVLLLVAPQIPMTIGNAAIAYTDLSNDYFEDASRRVTYRAACISMGLANLLSFAFGGMPLCHGAGGLAAHYRFGARTAGSNLIIGGIFFVLALFLGTGTLAVLHLLPMAVLGVLLLFAGIQLALTIQDLMSRKDLFVVLTMLGITLATNLAVGFIAGLALAYALKWEKFTI